jgi:hypothetical protein
VTGGAVLRGVLAAQQPWANAIPLFFGENRTFDGEARASARRVDLQRDGALDDRHAAGSMTSADEGSNAPRVASAAPVHSGDRSRRWRVR